LPTEFPRGIRAINWQNQELACTDLEDPALSKKGEIGK
jgi:hypothetical protein